MPNLSQSRLVVLGETVALEAFVSRAASDERELDFSRHVPPPVGFDDLGSDERAGWLGTNWGTKWNAQDVAVKRARDWVAYEFETAWGPPLPWLRTASREHPDLQFHLTFWIEGSGPDRAARIEDGREVQGYPLYLKPGRRVDWEAMERAGRALGRSDLEDDHGWLEDLANDSDLQTQLQHDIEIVRAATAKAIRVSLPKGGEDLSVYLLGARDDGSYDEEIGMALARLVAAGLVRLGGAEAEPNV